VIKSPITMLWRGHRKDQALVYFLPGQRSKFKPLFAAKRTPQRRTGGETKLNAEIVVAMSSQGSEPMTSADGIAAPITTPEFVNAVGGVRGPDHNKLEERASAEDFQSPGDQRRPVEDLHNLLLRISHHLDFETSERATIYYRLLAIDEQTKKIINQTRRRVLHSFVRYLVAICVGVAGTLAWQFYGGETKQMIATGAPELGWSPETKQMIGGWVQQLGWTKSPANSETAAVQATVQQPPQAAAVAEPVAVSAPAAPAVDPEQVQQIALGLAAMRQSLDQIASAQGQMAREIAKLQTADVEILEKIPAPSRQPGIPPARKPISVSPPSHPPIPAR
jgi:hypothetical protein